MSQPVPTGSSPAAAMSRRRFLATTGRAAAAFSIVKPAAVRGTTANGKVRLGVIGCGGRGRWIAELFRRHGGYQIAALADYFQDRVDEAGEKLGVPAQARLTGLSGYRRMLEGRLVDAVAVESPPFFHPAQAAEAVDAGAHVFLAKPIAVDVPGCRTVEQSAAKAAANRLCFLVDFQTRANALFREAIRRVHEGALGRLAFGEATYHAEDPWEAQHEFVRQGTTEGRLRGWGLSRELSGDIITEQNIHTIDVASWIMRQPPVGAYGTGGRKYRDVGTCWDTFTVTFEYPDDVGIAFSSRQFNGHGTRPEGIRNRMFGSDGVLETEYGGEVLLRGKQFYRGGSTAGIYEDGAVANIASFHESIQRADYSQPTVAESVRSNLVTILGRTAAYEHRVVTWDEVLRRDERLVPDLAGLKD